MEVASVEKTQRKKGDTKQLIYQSGENAGVGFSKFPAKDILKTYHSLYNSNSNIIANAHHGLAISAISDFRVLSGKSQKEIAALIHTTPKTLQNYAAGARQLPTLQSELLLKLFALYAKGLDVFGEAENFNSWLKKSAFGLYNDIPETLLTTSTGINEVMDELVRIEYGDLA